MQSAMCKVQCTMHIAFVKSRQRRKNILFREFIFCSCGLYAVQGGYMLFPMLIWMLRMVVYCSGGLGGLYAVQEGYGDVQGGCGH